MHAHWSVLRHLMVQSGGGLLQASYKRDDAKICPTAFPIFFAPVRGFYVDVSVAACTSFSVGMTAG